MSNFRKYEMAVTFLSTIPFLSVDTFSLLHYHTMVGMFHMYQCEGDRFYLFLHFRNYRQSIIPYFIIPSTFSPQASSPLEHYRRTERWTKLFTPCPLSYYCFHWALEALPAGATLLGWPNYGVDGQLNKFKRGFALPIIFRGSGRNTSIYSASLPPCGHTFLHF